MDGAEEGVFMEAVAEIATGEKGVGGARCGGVESGKFSLGSGGAETEERVGVIDRLDDFCRVDAVGAVDGNEILLAVAYALKGVHPVVGGGLDAAVGGAQELVVPARPGPAGFGHDGGVGVEGGDVGLIVEFAKQAGFGRGGVDEEAQGLVAVGGDDDLVEGVGGAAGGHDGDAARGAHDARGAVAEAEAVAPGGDEAAGVFAGAAVNRPPRVLGVEAEEAVVMEKAQQGGGGKGEHELGRGAPHGGAHGHEVEVKKIFAVAAVAHVVAEGFGGGAGIGEGDDGVAVEAVDGREHFQEAQVKEIFALGEKVVEGAAAPLEAAGVVAHGEGHGGGFHGDLKLVEEAAELRVGHAVENHEAGVDGQGAAGAGLGGLDGVGVAAEVVVLLKNGNVVVAVQEVGAAEAGDAGADDGDT